MRHTMTLLADGGMGVFKSIGGRLTQCSGGWVQRSGKGVNAFIVLRQGTHEEKLTVDSL